MSVPKILIVDDEADMAEYISVVTAGMDLEPISATTAQEALRLAEDIHPAAIITDIIMPGMDGIEFVQALGKRSTGLPLILMSGYQDLYCDLAKTIADSAGLVVIGKLHKPFRPEKLECLLTKLKDSWA